MRWDCLSVLRPLRRAYADVHWHASRATVETSSYPSKAAELPTQEDDKIPSGEGAAEVGRPHPLRRG